MNREITIDGLPTPALETAAEMWASYRRDVLPADAPDVQVLECKRAFYAGMVAVYTVLTFGVGSDSVTEEAGMEYLARLGSDLRAFGRSGGTT